MADQDFERVEAGKEAASILAELTRIGTRMSKLSEFIDPGADGERSIGNESLLLAKAHNALVESFQGMAKLAIEMNPSVMSAEERIDRMKREEG